MDKAIYIVPLLQWQ